MSIATSTEKIEFTLEGLDCASCAAKIEAKVKELDDVLDASINFVTQTLSLKIKKQDQINQMITEVKAIVNHLEPDVIVKEKITTQPVKKTLVLENLSCASCATKIEDAIKQLPGIKQANVDFVSSKLIIEVYNKNDLSQRIEDAKKIIDSIEPDVQVYDTDQEYNDGHSNNVTDSEEGEFKKRFIQLGIGAALFATAIAFKFTFWIEFILYFISYIIIGGEVLLRAAKNIKRGQIFDENFLISVATIGAFAIKEFPEGVAVMLFYQVGELFQDMAVNRSRKSIAALMDIRPDFANLKVGEEIKKVSPEDVNIGDVIIVKPGEKVPLDGKIIEGSSMVDTSALTGESVPREVEAGSEILAGFINKSGLIAVEVTEKFGESTVSKILDLVQNASSKKAPTENFITKFSRYYTPVVVGVALILATIPPLIIDGATFSQWIYRALIFLVISCPCALVISIPLGFFGGIGGASRNGILVKGGNYLEALNSVDTVVFDKTGTLTKGVFNVTEIITTGSMTKDELLEFAAYAESYSNHPIAISILKAYNGEVNKNNIENYDEISGHGTKVTVNGKEILAGNSKLMIKEGIEFEQIEATGTIVHIAIDKQYAGYIVIADEIKEDSIEAIRSLKDVGVRKTVMLTGDIKKVGEKVAKQLGLDEVYAELLPDQKVEKLEMLDNNKPPKKKLVFVGDGINDAPVLARADIGIAMGGLGSDAAIEAADVVIMTDEPSKIATAIKIAKRTRRIVWQNIYFSLGVKLIVLILGAGGLATLWEAVFADVGVALIAVFNAMRVLKVDNI
ncbi:cadmium-translocating P-type ATPase [Vulcanibacillus modesticaldus]|uniref:Cadmium-translocating P-type ATPase n=1 Tax=Vulcanibacillus modesticaldus TaxID=337097 RepID=A0A1D2YUG8_9BACI|nr:heavy metal translocating P-type ATPase [Vulcanibacillus modesticaldus]OEF99327.1 cadmium-translocating P-type ATPase [Vulcanibacillus modesticaldus]